MNEAVVIGALRAIPVRTGPVEALSSSTVENEGQGFDTPGPNGI